MNPAKHYSIPPLQRFDLDEVLRLIRDERYFVLHAPRQTGKTSALLALRDSLNAEGEYRCVYTNVEAGQTARSDVGAGIQAVLAEISERALVALGDGFLDETWERTLSRAGPHSALRQALGRWSLNDPKRLVLLIDETDALVGDTLISVLRQLRAGYDLRPAAFPQSVILCGIRDVRDYRIHSESAGEVIAGGSAFNIKAKSLRLGDFEEADCGRCSVSTRRRRGRSSRRKRSPRFGTSRGASRGWSTRSPTRPASITGQPGTARGRSTGKRSWRRGRS